MLENITWLGHASFRIDGAEIIYVDPWKVPAGSPPADIILITHDHHDHCSPDDVRRLSKTGTVVVCPASCRPGRGAKVMSIAPGETVTVGSTRIEAVPAYNIGKTYHPKENGWVGFIVETGGRRIYHAGDSDFVPEMNSVRADVMLVPVGGIYTMTGSEAARAVRAVNPRVAVPMHWGDIVGSAADAENLRREAGIPVEILAPGGRGRPAP